MQNRAECKANLMQLAEAEIEQLLDWTEATGSPELVQIEEVVLKIRQRIGESMTREVIANQCARCPVQTDPSAKKRCIIKG